MAEITKKSNNWQKLLDLQNKLVAIGKNKTADAGKFSYPFLDYPKVKEKIQPLFAEYGWALTQIIEYKDNDNTPYLTSTIYDVEAGEKFLSNSMPLVVLNPKDNHDWGAALTYAQRYTVMTMLGLAAGKDDDAIVTDNDIKKSISKMETVEDLENYYKAIGPARGKEFLKEFAAKKKELQNLPGNTIFVDEGESA